MKDGLCSSNVLEQETYVESPILSVAMFKNGLAVIKRIVEVPGSGTYLVNDIPEPVHGTFWIESEADVEARIVQREMETALRFREVINFQEEFAGHDVVLHFCDSKFPPIRGTVLKLAPSSAEEARSTHEAFYRENAKRDYLILNTENGRTFVMNPSTIASIEVQNPHETSVERRPVLLLSISGENTTPLKIILTYLAIGIAWAPSYQIDISDPNILTMTQQAVIKNELGPISHAEMYLISGFPSIQFAHVTSPFSLRTTWAKFFQQLNQRIVSERGLQVFSQTVSRDDNINPNLDISASSTGEGADIHYQPIGQRSLAKGDSLLLNVAAGNAPYERLFEWLVPDTMTTDGRYLSQHEREEFPEKYQDAVWEVVHFKNPLPFPMSTGATMVVGAGHFQGQRMSCWVNQGEEATIRITKALSIRTRQREYEEPGKRNTVFIAKQNYTKCLLTGELFLWNSRDESVKIIIRRQFSGELLEADGEPQHRLREEGVWSVNTRNELIWTQTLKPGGEIHLIYRYSILTQ